MAQLPTTFNAHIVDPSQPVSMLPVSDQNGHPVIIVSSEFKPTKNDQNSGFLELMLQIIDGPHKGETGAYRLNLFNANAQAVDIASRQLSALCHVTGQMMLSDSSQLHNIPFRAIVGMQKKATPDAPDYTQVNGVLDINGNKPGKAGQPAPQAAPQTQQGWPAPAPVAPAQPTWGQPAPQAAPSAPPAPTGEVKPPWAK